MSRRVASFRNRRYNAYVPACAYSVDVIHGAPHMVDFGTPIAADPDGILDGTDITVAGSTTTFLTDTADAPFGRNVTLVASGASTVAVTVTGKDYLGQPMNELFALNGTTPVVGVKAFKWIDSITWAASAVTVDIGFGDKLGLPYRMSNVMEETANGAEASIGTFVAGVLTDPQTTTTVDPRGTYDASTAYNGSNRIMATFLPYNILNSSGNGGLFGIKHV